MVAGMHVMTEKIGPAALDDDDERPFAGARRHAQPADQAPTPTVGAAPGRARRDQDDRLIQTLYGVNLELEGAAEDVAADPDAARARIETAIERLAAVMRDVRRMIMGPGPAVPPLEPPAGMPADRGFQAIRAAGAPEREEHHA